MSRTQSTKCPQCKETVVLTPKLRAESNKKKYNIALFNSTASEATKIAFNKKATYIVCPHCHREFGAL